jgi:two-component system, OmpR family, phosphate regulon response regulator PhoB
MVKLLSLAELVARIRALLRRTPVIPGERRLRWREITIDLPAFDVTRNGRKIHLGPIEFRLLKFLLQIRKAFFLVRKSLMRFGVGMSTCSLGMWTFRGACAGP